MAHSEVQKTKIVALLKTDLSVFYILFSNFPSKYLFLFCSFSESIFLFLFLSSLFGHSFFSSMSFFLLLCTFHCTYLNVFFLFFSFLMSRFSLFSSHLIFVSNSSFAAPFSFCYFLPILSISIFPLRFSSFLNIL